MPFPMATLEILHATIASIASPLASSLQTLQSHQSISLLEKTWQTLSPMACFWVITLVSTARSLSLLIWPDG